MVHLIRRAEVFGDGSDIAAERLRVIPDEPAHGHDFVELVVVRSGEGAHTSRDGTRWLARGDAMWVRPGEWHGYQTDGALEVSNVYVATQLVRDQTFAAPRIPEIGRLLDAPGSEPCRLQGGALRSAEQWCDRLADEPTGGSPTRRLGLLLCLLAEVAAADDRPVADPGARSVDPVVSAAAAAMTADLGQVWTVLDLAHSLHVSAAHLSRRFSEQLGAPPMAWLARLRAERAAALLIETDLPVAEIGRRVGWSDPNYASRRFGQLMGCSPAAYRARYVR